MKVAVSQRFLPHYRLAFYERLVNDLRLSGASLRLFYGYPLGPVKIYPWGTQIGGLRFRLLLGEITETVVVSPRIFTRLSKFRPDVVILEDISGLPTSLIAAIYCRIQRTPYLIWGLGSIPGKKRSLLRFLFWPFIKFLYSGSTAFICYSRYAEKIYGAWRKPTFVAPNATLSSPSEIHVEKIERRIKQKYWGDSRSVVAIGELRYQKRFDVLLTAISKLETKGVELHIIGDGPERDTLKGRAEELGITNVVHFHGAIFDNQQKGKVISGCSVGVLPGRGGLVIQELMYWGIPVICGAADGTELDNVADGGNGYLLHDARNPAEIARAIDRFFQLTDVEAVNMARKALLRTVEAYNVESMVRGVQAAIQYAFSDN